MLEVPYFHNFIDTLPDHIRDQIHAVSTVRHYSKGTTIYDMGDECLALYQIKSGSVRLCNYSLSGKEVIIGDLEAGDCFGEMGFVDGLGRFSRAISIADTELYVVDFKDFGVLYDKYPEIGKALNRLLCNRLRMTLAMVEDAKGLTLREFLARTLIRLAHSYKPDPQADEAEVGISQEELANLVGASRQSVNKELKALAEQDIVEIRYGKITVRNLKNNTERFEPLLGLERTFPNYRSVTPRR